VGDVDVNVAEAAQGENDVKAVFDDLKGKAKEGTACG